MSRSKSPASARTARINGKNSRKKWDFRGNSTFYILPDLIDLLMILRKIGRLPDQRGFNTVRGYSIMAMNKTAGEEEDRKKAVKSTAKKAVPKKAVARPAKKAAPKKAAGPKLSDPQHALLAKVAGHSDPLGYYAEKKPENKTLETLLKHKLVKKGKKHASGNYHYQATKAGHKHLQTSSAPAAVPKSS